MQKTGELGHITGFEVTQKILLEQTLHKLYRDTASRLALQFHQQAGYLMPDYLMRVLGSLNRGTVVEIGCEYGFASNIASLLYPDTHVVGMDTDVEKIATAQRTIGSRRNLEFYACDFSKVPRINTDLIILNLNTQDIPEKTLKRLYDWLSPGGDLLIRTPHRQTTWKNYLQLLHPSILARLIQRDPELDLSFLNPFPTKKLLSTLHQLGYAVLPANTAPVNQGYLNALFAGCVAYEYHHVEKPLSAIDNRNRHFDYELHQSRRQQKSVERVLRSRPAPLPTAEPHTTLPLAATEEDVLGFIFSREWAPLAQEI